MLHKIASASRVGRAALAVGILPAFALAQVQGPSSSQTPYVLPVAPGVQTVSIVTVGDAPTGYTFVGIPDGIGPYATAPGAEFEVVVNHEFTSSVGAVHAHGQAGAFVSRWTIRKSDLAVIQGEDLIQNANVVNGTTALSRLCSGDLPLRRAFFINSFSAPYIFLSGEETGAEGRAFAHIASGTLDGQSYELPYLGKMSWENAVARPFASTKTLVMGLDDSTPGQVYCYIGTKTNSGSPIKRAGLTNGVLYGIRVPGVPLEDRDNALFGETRFELASLGNVAEKTGAEIQTDSVALGVTEFLRPEDGTWSRQDSRTFYFVTTDRFDTATTPGRSRLYQLTFDSALNPEQGGTITILLDGTEGQQMMDNLTIDRNGNLLIQEDVGNQAHLGRILQYTPSTDQLKVLAEHDAARFVSGGASFLTQDEESSGIIDAREYLGGGWFLFDCQAHYSIPGDLVEGGQLLALYNPDSL